MKRFRAPAALGALLLAFATASCSGAAVGSVTDGDTLTLLSLTDNNSFDPAELEIGHRAQYWMPVYDTLLVLDEHSVARPNLATHWSYDDAETTLTLSLREGVSFTDGTAFDADAVRENLEHFAAGNGQNSYMLAALDRVEIIDEHHLRLMLSQPDPGLISYLAVAAGAMASPAALESPDLAMHPVGSGPYLLDPRDTRAGTRFVYVRNDDYWNPSAFPYERIVITPMSDVTARLNALRSGQADAGLGSASVRGFAERIGLDVHTTQVNWVGLVIADRDGVVVPELADARVRRAIALAFDRDAIVEHALQGSGTPTSQILNPTSAGFVPRLDDAYDYDLAEARALMAEAGCADGFTVTMPDIAGYEDYRAIIDHSLGELGISIDWTAEATDTAIGAVLSGKYPMFFFALGSQSVWQDLSKAVLPDSPWNPFHVEDPELSAMIAAARSATGGTRTDRLREIDAWLVDEAWFAPLFRETTVYLSRPETTVRMQSQNVVPWISGYAPKTR